MVVRGLRSSMRGQGLNLTLGVVLVFCSFLTLFQTAFASKDSDDEVDFEFADSSTEQKTVNGRIGLKDENQNQNVLCKNLQCKPHQVCVVKTQNIAACISRKKLQYNGKKKGVMGGDEDPRLWPDPGTSSCQPCPVVKPQFVCAADNQTYSSECRLQYHNCVHKTNYAILCEGFCPCKDSMTENDLMKEAKLKERWNNYINKYQNTINKMNSKNYKPESGNNSSGNKKPFKILSPSRTPDFEKSSQATGKGQRKKGCTREDLKMMGDRLLDWFSVVMADHQTSWSKLHDINKSAACKVEVKWMFQHLDNNGDGQLSLRELYDLEHDEREHCLQPYLADCDANRDLFLSNREWCACFEKSKRPCRAARERSPDGLNGAYVPQCDDDGYYQPRQCHSSIGMCWCVDKHGVEFKNTRRKGFPDCVSLLKRALHKPREEDEDQEDDSYEDQEEGSADKPLDF